MNQRDTDAAAIVGRVDLSNARPDGGSGPPTGGNGQEQEFELQEPATSTRDRPFRLAITHPGPETYLTHSMKATGG
jgi:hypothetical protein